MYYYEPLHMAEQKQGDQLEPAYSSSVRIRGVALGTCRKQWMIGRGGEKVSRISVLAARQDDEMRLFFNLYKSAINKHLKCKSTPFNHYYFSPCEFSTPVLTGGLKSERHSLQISRTRQSILVNNAVFQMLSFQGFRGTLQAHLLQLISPSSSCSSAFSALRQDLGIFLSFHLIFFFILWQNSLDGKFIY